MNICVCERPTRDDAFVCSNCIDDLARDLGECPWLDEQLDISITRQRGAATTGGPNSGETALPWHDKASGAQRDLHATLATWVRLCSEDHVRADQARNHDWPDDDIPAMSRWLMLRADGLALHQAGFDAVRDVARATERARSIVFYKPEARQYLGACDVVFEETGPCEGDVYAEAAEVAGFCQVCAEPYSVEERRDAMQRELDDRLYTAAEIAHLATYLGLDVRRERVRKQVNAWHSKKQIGSHAGEGEDARFRYGTVRVMLYRKFAEKAG